jgi:RecA/RadA recombinase
MAKENKHLTALRKHTKSDSFANNKNKGGGNISTGDYGLNRIISGDINKGIPNGKIVLFGGESSSGKSLIVAKIAVNAIKAGYERVFYFDSEGGALQNFFESEGADSNKIEQMIVGSVEDATVQILKTFEAIKAWQEEEPDVKFLCVLDSLGALVSNKLITDATEKSRQASDMGLTAKLKNNLMKSLPGPCAKTNTAMLIVNHIYDDPAAMHPTKIKAQSGGKGVQYMSHISIQCHKKPIKNENKKDDGDFYNATVLRFLITKNREVRPFFESEMFLNFATGIVKWYSLWEPALLYGFIEQHGAWYVVPSYGDGTKKLRRNDILLDDEVWASFIDAFNEHSMDDMSYSGGKNIDKTDDEVVANMLETLSVDAE